MRAWRVPLMFKLTGTRAVVVAGDWAEPPDDKAMASGTTAPVARISRRVAGLAPRKLVSSLVPVILNSDRARPSLPSKQHSNPRWVLDEDASTCRILPPQHSSATAIATEVSRNCATAVDHARL